jgi:two-component system NtrC family sensor kinase
MQITTKLVLALVTIVVIVAVVSGYYIYKAEERQLLKLVVLGSDQLSRSITSATWHAMLADRRTDAYQVMENIAHKQGVDRFRLYNRTGVITFSTEKAETGTQAEMSSGACARCHDTGRKIDDLSLDDRVREFRGDQGERLLSISTPIPNEPACSQAACHAHPAGEKVLGVLELRLDLAHVDEDLTGLKQRIALRVLVEILLICPFLYFFARTFIRNPIQKLIEGTKAISRMDLNSPVPVPTHGGEVAQLARSFDQMRVRLRDAVEENSQFTLRLEEKVEARTQELRIAHQKLIQSDRLASLGQLSASVAHEINNPVAGVLNLSMLMQRLLKEDGVPAERLSDFRRYLSQVVSETSRVGRIVSDLLAFSRRSAPHRSPSDLNSIVQTTLSLVSHKLKLSNVETRLELAESLPPVLCDRPQLQQVILNLVLNASEAMHGKPGSILRIATSARDGKVSLTIADNGEGIAAANLSRIFDPFFTTKPEGKGVGLGLAVSYGIIQAHGGDIEVESQPREGATFRILLPVAGVQSG